MSVAIVISVLAILTPLLIFIRKYIQGGQFEKTDIRVDNKVIIITGCNTGIGKQTVLELAKRGGRIYMACRDQQKCELARQECIEQSGNSNIFTNLLDLSSIKSIRKFVIDFKTKESHLDILINNAGVFSSNKRQLTEDNFEQTIGVNHLGHFLLTNLLLPLLLLDENNSKNSIIQSSSPAKSSRIINVSSMLHYWGKLNKTDLMSEKSYSKINAYMQSKLANILFTRALAKRLVLTNCTVNSIHPGVVKTDLQRNQPFLLRLILYPIYLFFKSPKSGAQTTIRCAIDPELSEINGRYFSDCKIKMESLSAQDDELAEWLWDISEKLTKLKE